MASAGEPKSPTLEELPKISADLKQEVTKDHPLKHVEVNEKNVLPTEQGKHEDARPYRTPYHTSTGFRTVPDWPSPILLSIYIIHLRSYISTVLDYI